MIIGIDIDDTITNHCEAWFAIYNEHFKTDKDNEIRLEDAYKWDFYDEYDKSTKEHLFNALNNQTLYYLRLRLLDNVERVIQEIIDSGHQIILLSATTPEHQEEKKKWILEKLPMLSENDIIFSTKKELFNVDLMIDDNLSYASKFKCPFILFKRPWNTNREPELYSNNIFICSNWNEIEKYLAYKSIIVPEVINSEVTYNEATVKLIEGIKNAETNQECVKLLNPYIEMWQEQGVLIGISRVSEFIGLLAKDVEKNLGNK